MQHWWKWAPALAVILGIPLLMALPAQRESVLGRAEAAVAGHGWPSWTNPSTKIVPIVSLGTPGLRLGMAQVSGPRLRVANVRAVLQIDGDFKSVRAKILVPSDSMTDLRRVQGTAVTAVVQYELLSFSKKAGTPAQTRPERSEKQCHPKPKHKSSQSHHGSPGYHKGWKQNKHRQCEEHKGGR